MDSPMNNINVAALALRARLALLRLGAPACIAIVLCATGVAAWAWLLPQRAAQSQLMARPLPAPTTLVTPPPPPSAWRISADWDPVRPFFAAAVPNTLLAALQLVAQEFKLTIVGIEPRFVGALNRNRRGIKQGAWFGVVHDKLLTLAAIEGEGNAVRAIRPLPIPHGADQYWLTQTLQREALLLDMAAPELLQVCGEAPTEWTKPAGGTAHIACAALGGSAS